MFQPSFGGLNFYGRNQSKAFATLLSNMSLFDEKPQALVTELIVSPDQCGTKRRISTVPFTLELLVTHEISKLQRFSD